MDVPGDRRLLKVRAAGLELEGTPEELADLLHRLGLTTAVATPAAPSQARLVDPPTNELLLHDYAKDTGLSALARARYATIATDLDRLVSPKSLLDLSIEDARRYERQLLERCGHHQQTVLAGRGRVGPQRHRCGVGLYPWTLALPGTCSSVCAQFQRQTHGPESSLKGARHFFEFLRERGLVTTNPFSWVARRHARVAKRNQGQEKAKYAPTTDEVRAIVQTARRILSPRDAGLLLALAKLGRRPGHVYLLDARDVIGLHEGSLAWIDFAGAKERVLARNRDGYSKLQGNLIAPLDEEFRTFLRDELLPWRARRWGYSDTEGPLFPNEQGGGHLRSHVSVGIPLERVVRHLAETAGTPEDRAHWEARAEPGGRFEILPGGFRHWYTTTLADFGAPQDERMILRGDKIPDAEDRYRHLSPERIAAMNRLPPLLV